ncbi:TatD family hydrolase, partial [Acinetobacter baumannii]|uniref:TatD family hydrolase n=1 Tax=Acinetobacter baumannii TaxID=470 RepID=UPI00148A405D
ALAAARAEGFAKSMATSVDYDDHMAIAEIATRHEDVGYMVGVHPCEHNATMASASTEYLPELAQSEKVWDLGETGLD